MSSQQYLLRFMALSLGLPLICNLAATAQETRSAILGTVRDATGAVIANAAVTIANNNTNITIKLTTGGNGYFEAPYLLAGSYTITVEAAGF